MESVRGALHDVALALSRLLDPVVGVLAHAGAGVRRFMDGAGVPVQVQPVGIIALWVVLVLLLIRLLRGGARLLALLFVAVLLLRIYRVLPDI